MDDISMLEELVKVRDRVEKAYNEHINSMDMNLNSMDVLDMLTKEKYEVLANFNHRIDLIKTKIER